MIEKTANRWQNWSVYVKNELRDLVGQQEIETTIQIFKEAFFGLRERRKNGFFKDIQSLSLLKSVFWFVT